MKYDGPSSSFRPRNKTTSLINGADIPNRYESRLGEKNRNKANKKGQSVPFDEEKDDSEFEDEVQTDVTISEDINGKDNDAENDRFLNRYPTADKDLANVSDTRKTQKGKINSNANVDSMKTRKVIAGKGTNRRPASSTMKQDDNVPETDISEGDGDREITQEYDEESDLINYRDDPNSRTDFHGINRYLPNPKGSNRFNQTDGKRILVRPGGTRQKVKGKNKSNRTGNRKNQPTQDTIPDSGSETEEDTKDEDRIVVPVRNNAGMKKIESSKTYEQKPTYNDKESETYVDGGEKDNKKNAFDDELETSDKDISTQTGVYQFDKKVVGKPIRPNKPAGASKDNNAKPLLDVETGYEYIPPQRKFELEGNNRLPSKTSFTGKPRFPTQGVQTTVRPFMTPNVYKTEEVDDDQFDSEGKPFRPVQPTNSKVQDNKALLGNNRYSENSYPEITNNDRFDKTTPSRRPFGGPQTTSMPSYKDQAITGNGRNDEFDYQGLRKPGNKVIYSTNAPIEESNTFVSTAPVPNSEYQYLNEKQRPGQYQETNIANGPLYAEKTAPGRYVQKNTPYGQETMNSKGQVPSTTFRPSYTLGDKTLAPSGPIAVDGFGRPISSTDAPIYSTTYRPVTQGSRISIENQPDQMGESGPSGRFGVTSVPTKGPNGYQGSTSGSSEDFSGPKQPQKFDPNTGYYY